MDCLCKLILIEEEGREKHSSYPFELGFRLADNHGLNIIQSGSLELLASTEDSIDHSIHD